MFAAIATRRLLVIADETAPSGMLCSWCAPRSSAEWLCPEATEEHPHGMRLDTGYADAAVREVLEACGFTAQITARGADANVLQAEAGTRARHWVVERSHRWMNRFGRILVRWDTDRPRSV